MAKIFISYRRQDRSIADQVRAQLTEEFGGNNVLMDTEDVVANGDFHPRSDRLIAGATIVLVLIGHGWTEARDDTGQRLLDKRLDAVRVAIEAALRNKIPLVPVLIDDASMPQPEKMPAEIRSLLFRAALRIDAAHAITRYLTTAGGAAAGAAIGAIRGFGLGTVIGGLIGALTGAVGAKAGASALEMQTTAVGHLAQMIRYLIDMHALEGKLIENIPRKMRVGVSEPIDIRIGKEELVTVMTQSLIGNADAKTHTIEIVESMSVRLFAPEGGFEIVGASPETQIVDSSTSKKTFGVWLWKVTPLRRGHHVLQICVAAQVKTKDGLPAHSSLPVQIIEIEVAVNYRSLAGRTIVIGSGAISSAFLGAIISDKWPAIRDFVGTLFGR